jgi:hypothetical protein
MRTTLDIPDDLLERAKIAAVERGATLRELAQSLQWETVTFDRGFRSFAKLKLRVLKASDGHTRVNKLTKLQRPPDQPALVGRVSRSRPACVSVSR